MPLVSTSSFNSVPITVLAGDVPRHVAPERSVRKIPGGAVSYIDVAGPALPTLTLRLLFLSEADALAFEAQSGQDGSLVIFDGTWPAFCDGMDRASRSVNDDGTTELSVSFVILGPHA